MTKKNDKDTIMRHMINDTYGVINAKDTVTDKDESLSETDKKRLKSIITMRTSTMLKRLQSDIKILDHDVQRDEWNEAFEMITSITKGLHYIINLIGIREDVDK